MKAGKYCYFKFPHLHCDSWLLVWNPREPVALMEVLIDCSGQCWMLLPSPGLPLCNEGLFWTFPLTHQLCARACVCVCVCVWRLCVCDMDRLGRNEFIGEVRVALKKLKEGDNKRYNMGLERIAQVRKYFTAHHFPVDLWEHIYQASFWIEPGCLRATPPSIRNSLCTIWCSSGGL